MNYKTECGCIVVESPPNFKIKYCPKHKAAPDMHEALKDWIERQDEWGNFVPLEARQALKEIANE